MDLFVPFLFLSFSGMAWPLEPGSLYQQDGYGHDYGADAGVLLGTCPPVGDETGTMAEKTHIKSHEKPGCQAASGSYII